MKILLVSIPSIHVERWIKNIQDLGCDIYWFDVLNRGNLDHNLNVIQFTGWKKRKLPMIKGETFLKVNFPEVYRKIQPRLEVSVIEEFSVILNRVKPDIVHSFELTTATERIYKIMQQNKIKWIYSCWGSDLYFHGRNSYYSKKIPKLLKRVDCFIADCNRDLDFALTLGFDIHKKHEVIPGGGGYHIDKLKVYRIPLKERNIILVKGYQKTHGRAIQILKALEKLESYLGEYQIIVFASHSQVHEYARLSTLNLKVFHRHELEHEELLKLMGSAKLYIGNNISDGIPNTLIEAMIMGAFPIQSNPGGATAEIIANGDNGYCIQEPENSNHIRDLILAVLENEVILESAVEKNDKIVRQRFEYDFIQNKIFNLYLDILSN